MSYKVQHTETTNPSKPPITVEDQTLNTDTSVTLVGKNYPGYSKYIGENFLHLLENFAKNTPPSVPVEGQLWYDNSPDVNLLKVYDGTQWTAAGSVKKAPVAPSTGIVGDLWVNTNTQQLHVYSGSNWLLIGPQYTSGAKTGPDVETIVDTNNVEHNVMTFYANNYKIAILSKEAFVPKLLMAGFETIGQGLNISSVDVTSTSSPTKVWGTASKADALVINNVAVASTNFLRTDVSSISNATIGVRSNGGLTVGSDLSFNVATDSASNSAVLYSKASGGNLDVRLTASNGTITNVIRVDATNKVGINNTAPQEALDVTGNFIVSGNTTISGMTSTDDITVNGMATFNGDIETSGQTNISYLDIDGNPTTAAVILPSSDSADALYDIGTEARRFRNIYAQEFVGSFNGSFTGSLAGSITGSAAKLSSPTTFQLLGDVSSDAVPFDGQTPQTGYPPGVIKLTTTINQNLITSRDLVSDSLSADQLLVYRSGASGGLKKLTKQTFVSSIPTVPIGAIFPYAGSSLPAGYLLCDGGEVKIADYTELFGVIGYTYKPTGLIGKNTFALPDLRGRFPLGRDSMDNGTTVPDKDDPNILLDAGGGIANRVTSPVADNLGNGSGQEELSIDVNNLPDHQHTLQSASQRQYFAAGSPSGTADDGTQPGLGISAGATGYGLPNSGGVDSTRHGDALNIMNPYLTINYIIFTGVL